VTADVANFDLYTGGRWRPARSGATDIATNPATGRPVATVASGAGADIDDAVAGAREAFGAWSTASAFQRASVLTAMAAAVEAHKEALALILSLDQGKPLAAVLEGEGAPPGLLAFGGRAGSVSGTGRVGGASPLERFTEPKTITFPLAQL
jgi:acyl-CoA reductase-like NAD-dependent aldehyde dehydrogenase